MPRFIEVSHVIEPGMVTYPGLPAPIAEVIVDHDTSYARYQGKSEFLIASLHICGNTGTYVDSPLHRHRGAADLAGLPLERVAHVPVRVFDARSLGRVVGPELFKGADVRGAAVIVRTDFSQHWRTERYGRDNPFLTAPARQQLAALGYTTTFQLSRANPDLADLTGYSDSRLIRFVAGARGALPALGRDWRYEVSVNWGRSRFVDHGQTIDQQRFVNAVNVAEVGGRIVCSVTPTVTGLPSAPIADPACQPLSLFGARSPSAAALGRFSGSARSHGARFSASRQVICRRHRCLFFPCIR